MRTIGVDTLEGMLKAALRGICFVDKIDQNRTSVRLGDGREVPMSECVLTVEAMVSAEESEKILETLLSKIEQTESRIKILSEELQE